MKSRAYFHCFLSFAVLFASSLAAFHTSEHIGGEKPSHSAPNFSSIYANVHDHHDGHAHSLNATSDSGSNAHHGIASLCEECLFLSSLIAPTQSGSYRDLTLQAADYELFENAFYASQSFHNYLSRAPPLNS